MPHVTTHYRVYQVAGHHRQPRSSTTWIEPIPQSDAEVVPGTTITPFAPPQLAYTQGGQALTASFMFWSATDGSDGQTSTNATLNQTVGTNPMTLTAWYLPPGGPGGGGGSGWIIDAFSDALGDFVDDTFVTVTSDASLTGDANVVGFVPTAANETVVANSSVHTGESFEHWIGGPASGDTLSLAAGTSGLAIATYHRSHISIPNLGSFGREGVLVFGGVAVDGGGFVIPIGGGTPHPVGPWGPFIAAVGRAAGIGALATGLSAKAGAEIQRVAAVEAVRAAEANLKALEKQIG